MGAEAVTIKVDRAVELTVELVERAFADMTARHRSALADALKGMEDLRAEITRMSLSIDAIAAKRGEPGERGERGIPGIDGERGLPGRDGIDGERGIPGKDGRDGIDGKDGRDGVDGKDGAPGKDGRDGIDGKSLGMEDLVPLAKQHAALVARDMERVIAELPKAVDGKDGPRGERGLQGERGEKGDRGDPGRDGKDGRDGRNGIDGADGRDAASIDVLDEIVEGRTYARGVWANSAGGLWRFTGAQWQCIVDGVQKVDASMITERCIRLTTRYASGRIETTDFGVPALIYRETWEPKAYEVGDNVTWDGSMWVAIRATTATDKPGESTAFRLAVKRGRNGKSV